MSASLPCTRCGATPETGQSDGCPECEGVVGPLGAGLVVPNGVIAPLTPYGVSGEREDCDYSDVAERSRIGLT